MKTNNKGQFVRQSKLGLFFEGFGIWIDKKGYPTIWLDGKNVKIHVIIWERENGRKPKGHDIHHIDFDKTNYEYSNLQLETKSDHQKIHAGWVRKDGEWLLKPCKDCKQKLPLDKFYQRKGLTPSQRCISCSSVYFKKRNTDEYRAMRKVYMKKYYSKNKVEKWGVKI